MGSSRGGGLAATSLVFLLLLSLVPASHPVLEETPLVALNSGQDPGVSDVPTWRIGDRWIYAGTFDPTILVTDTGVQATVGEIQGDTTVEVTGISMQNVDNMSVLAYTLRTSANFDKSGVSLEGYAGNVYIQFTQTEYLRVSDLSPIRSELDLYIRFVPSGISFLEQLLGDITITTTYSPVNENYDFPIRIDERWTTTTTSYSQWSGQSDYITPFPPPETDTNTTTWVVSDVGRPSNSIGQTIDYGGCNESYEMTSFNSDGISEGYRWYCPEVRNYAWLHTADDIGLTIDFKLKRYDPVGATGVQSYTTLAPALNALKSSLNEALLPSTPRWESGLMRRRHAFLTQQDFHLTSITKWKASLHRSPPQPTGAHGPPWTSATPWIHLQLNWIMPVMAWLPNQAITSEHPP